MALDKIKLVNICDKIILFCLYSIAYFLPISKAIIESLSILAIVVFIIKKIIQREGLLKTRLNLTIFIYFIICFFSIFISSNAKISARTVFAKILQDIAFFFVVVETLNNERRLRNFLFIFFLSSALLGIDGIYQYFTRKDFIRHRPVIFTSRIYATFPTPNDFGCYLASLIPFVIACFFAKFNSKPFRFLFICLFVLLFICLMLTVSRGAWLAFVASVLFMSLWIYYLGLFFLALVILIIVTQQFYPGLIKERLIHFFSFVDANGLTIDLGAIDRKIIWQTAWQMFMYSPFIGIGIGTFMFNFDKFVIKGYPYGVPYAHNCYLQMASEIGIIGLLSFLAILIVFFYQGIKTLNNSEQKTFSWYVLLAALAAISGYCIQMGVDTIFYSLDLGILFWLMLGMGAAVVRNIKTI